MTCSKRLGKRPIRTNPDNIKSTAFLVHNLNGEELICLHNKTTNQLQLINLEKAFEPGMAYVALRCATSHAWLYNIVFSHCKLSCGRHCLWS